MPLVRPLRKITVRLALGSGLGPCVVLRLLLRADMHLDVPLAQAVIQSRTSGLDGVEVRNPVIVCDGNQSQLVQRRLACQRQRQQGTRAEDMPSDC